MSDNGSSGEMVAKGALSLLVVLVLLADPLPGDVVAAPPIIGAIWGVEEGG